MEHIAQSDLSCVRMAQDNHSQRVADQNEVQPQIIEQAAHGVVVRRQSREFVRGFLLVNEVFY